VTPANHAQRIAAEHCLLNYPTLYTAGSPQKGAQRNIWTVPVVVVRPHGDVVGTVGELTIDARLAKEVGGTAKEVVLAAGKALARTNRNGAMITSRAVAGQRG